MEWDSEDSLNHTLYRQFAPAQGRWETPDPKRGRVNSPQGQNLYAYVKDGPTNAVDPDGRGDPSCNMGFTVDDPCYCCENDPGYVDAHFEECCMDCGECQTTGCEGGGGGGGGKQTCTQKISDKPQLFNLCSSITCGDGKPAKFIQSWSCTGDWETCCLPLKDKFVDSCYDRGKGYVATEVWYNKSNPEADCCYCAK